VEEMTERHLDRLSQALRDKEGVIITYVSSSDPKPHDFLLFPKRVFERDGFTYVKGWSAHKPRRIMLFRGFHDSGKLRVFRVDRVLAVTERQPHVYSLSGYVASKIRRRGVIPGVWGLFLDLLLLAFFVGMAFRVIRWILGDW
jgi:predicted DNA-binding transcriptional regulator YafY